MNSQMFKGYCCKSDIALIAYSTFKIKFLSLINVHLFNLLMFRSLAAEQDQETEFKYPDIPFRENRKENKREKTRSRSPGIIIIIVIITK